LGITKHYREGGHRPRVVFSAGPFSRRQFFNAMFFAECFEEIAPNRRGRQELLEHLINRYL